MTKKCRVCGKEYEPMQGWITVYGTGSDMYEQLYPFPVCFECGRMLHQSGWHGVVPPSKQELIERYRRAVTAQCQRQRR